MKVDLEYGRHGLSLNLPDDLDVTIIRKRTLTPIVDEAAAVRQALASPVGCAPLRDLAQGCKSACILICDITRPVPNHLFLQPLIRILLDAGLQAHNITVLVATGLHRPNEGAELDALVNDPWVMQTVTVANHFARDADAHVDLGLTPTRGTPVKLDRRFVDADLRIATGLIEPHFMAGYSGGRKVVAPGIAHEETIRTFHSARYMEDPLATQCNLQGNPLHEEQLQIIAMLGDVYALNTVIDDHRKLVFVNFGEVIESHLQAVGYAHKASTVEVDRRFRTVVTSAAGYPLDRTYYQTVKGMVTPMQILDTPSDLIVASDCSEGVGSDAFRASQQRLLDQGSDRFLQGILRKALADVDEWQTQMQLKPMRVSRIHLYSAGLRGADRTLTGVNMIDSIEDAVMRSVERHGDRAVAVIPEGPYVIPRYVSRPH
ncbi:MAG: nickel-dependent lactate racemase [Proteobacteria bacterium]|nr:nickel-dependent lactate racemase [Pseudomonadota bacterium]